MQQDMNMDYTSTPNYPPASSSTSSMSSYSNYSSALGSTGNFQLRREPMGHIREIREDEVASTSVTPYTTDAEFDAFLEDATSVLASHANMSIKREDLTEYMDTQESELLDAFATIQAGDDVKPIPYLSTGFGYSQPQIKQECPSRDYYQTVEEFLKTRRIIPAAYFGARHIIPDDYVVNNRGPPNIDIQPFQNVDLTENKNTFMERLRNLVRSIQVFPKRGDAERAAAEMNFPTIPSEFPDWCHIYYYEFADRVGEIFKAVSPMVTIDGLCAPSDNSRFCLGAVGNPNRDPVAVAARRQIGRGCRLVYENGNVFVESVSECTLFVQSPIHARTQNDHLATVYRLPSCHRMPIFNGIYFNKLLDAARASNDFNQVYYLQSMCHVRMSFVKGWGERYRRQHITSTPCWVEIHFPMALCAVDEALLQVAAPTNDVHSDT